MHHVLMTTLIETLHGIFALLTTHLSQHWTIQKSNEAKNELWLTIDACAFIYILT